MSHEIDQIGAPSSIESKKRGSRREILYRVLTGGWILFVVWLLFAIRSWVFDLPSDGETKEIWKTKQAALHELVVMMKQDSAFVQVDINDVKPPRGLSEDRFKRYLFLLNDVGAYRVSYCNEGRHPSEFRIIIHLFRRGYLDTGSHKDLVFCPSGVLSGRPSADTDESADATAYSHFEFYSKIGDSWYIVYEMYR